MTKNPIRIAISIIAVLVFLFAVSTAHAAPTLLHVDGGGTGRDFFQSGSVLLGNGSNAIATTTRGDVTGTGITVTGGVNAILGSGLSLVLDLINLASGVTGTLPAANGGTGVSSFGGTNRVLFTPTADQLSSDSSFTFDGTSLSAPVLEASAGTNSTSTFNGNAWVKGNLRVDGQFFAPVSLVTSGNTTINGTLTTTGAVTGASFTSSGLGAVGTPAYSFSGDANTGLWSPSADSLALSTAGVQRFTVNSAGNVGIGTTTPDQKLVVAGSSAVVSIFDNSAVGVGKGGGLNLQHVNTAGSAVSYASLKASAAAGTPGVEQGDLVFNTMRVGTLTEAMRVLWNGNVGIGTTTATHKLTIAASQDNGIHLYDTTNLRSNYITSSSVGLSLNAAGSGLQLVAGGSERVRVTSSGTVGIGTTSPSALFSVAGAGYFTGNLGVGIASPSFPLQVVGSGRFQSTGAAQYLDVMTTDANNAYLRFVTSNSSRFVVGVDAADSNKFKIATANDFTTTRLTIDGSGNVGIGTSTPGSLLTVSGGNIEVARTNTQEYRFNGNAGRQWRTISTINGATNGYLLFQNTTDNFSSNFTNSIALKEDGFVGIGTTNPTASLEVYGASQTTAALTDAGVRTGILALNSSGSAAGDGGTITFGNSQSISGGSIGFAAIKGLLTNGSVKTIGDLAFSTRNGTADSALTERMRILANGNVGIGISSTNAKLDVNGIMYLRDTLSSGSGTNDAAMELGALGSGSRNAYIDLHGDDTYTDFGARFIRVGGANGQTTFDHRGTGEFNIKTTDAAALTFATNNTERMRLTATGNLGIGTTSPSKKLSVTGTVAFDGLTASIGAGSLCLTSGKEVVYNAGSDNCLSSTRASKHDIQDLSLGDFSVLEQLQPASFVYNDDATGTVRYGFIAEDAAAAESRLATRNASGEISGLDTNAFLAVIVDALKKVISRQNDTDARLEALEARLATLESENATLRTGRAVLACMLP